MSEAIKTNEKNLVALFSYLGLLILIPLFAVKHDRFVHFHLRQGLVLLVIGVCAAVPVVGPAFALAYMIFMIIGILNVLKGEEKHLPLIGQYAEKFKI
ncbi:MAG: hypothetical protein PHP03_00115 [Candidatus Pacebacteria bacterium]|nr:hypothetical protein [Candidatus Paceibacterota bacterium]